MGLKLETPERAQLLSHSMVESTSARVRIRREHAQRERD